MVWRCGEKRVPHWAYSVSALDPDKTVRCAGREMRISPKASVEICTTIRGMKIAAAKTLLEQVSRKERWIPYRRFNKEVAHHNVEKWHAGRYPVRAALAILKLVEELEANAEYRGLDVEKVKIIHAATQRGMKLRNYIPRAHGRSSPYFNTLAHVELVGFEGM